FVDTCASDGLLILTDKADFDKMRRVDKQVGCAALGTTLRVDGVGSIGGETDIYFCPTSRHNICAQGRLHQWGVGYRCDPHARPELVRDGETVLVGRLDASMPSFDKAEVFSLMHERHSIIQHISLYPSSVSAVHPLSPEQMLQLWHRRMCHMEIPRLANQERRMLTEGMHLPRDALREKHVQAADCPCRACRLAKVRRHSFKGADSMYYGVQQPAEMIVADWASFVNCPSRLGFLGAWNFTDVATRKTFTYCAAAKSSFLASAKKFKEEELDPLQRRWRCFHSDSDSAIMANASVAWFKEMGVRHTSSPTDTPEMNALPEVVNRELYRMTLALMIYANMAVTFWADAYMVATRVRGYMAARTAGGLMTPDEAWFGQLPNVKHLRVWGCLAWILEPRVDRRKDFHPRGVQGRLIGYSDLPKGWVFWVPEISDVVVSVNATFDENIPSCKEDSYFEELEPQLVPLDTIEGSITSYKKLVNQYYTDPDDNMLYQVAKVRTLKDGTIVAYVRCVREGRKTKPLRQPLHVRDVEQMVARTDQSTTAIEASLSALLSMETTAPSVSLVAGAPAESSGTADPMQERREVNHRLLALGGFLGVHQSSIPPNTKGRDAGGQAAADAPHPTRAETDHPTCASLEQGTAAGALAGEASHPPGHPSIRLVTELSPLPTPNTRAEALASPEADQWLLAERAELDSMESREVIEGVVPIPDGVRPIKSRWLYKWKEAVDAPPKAKARLVAKGYSQVAGVDYGDTFAPTGKNVILRLLLNIMLMYGMTCHHIDVNTAFLYATLEKPVYMSGPDGYTCSPGQCFKVQRAIYGLKSSPREWNKLLRGFILSMGFLQSTLDPCVFYSANAYNPRFVLIYVDDILLFAMSDAEISLLKEAFMARFQCKDLGPISRFLGINIHYLPGVCVRVDQSHYAEAVVTKFAEQFTSLFTTPRECPLPYDTVARMDDESQLEEDSNFYMWWSTFPYMSVIGSVLYLAINTRPDVMYAVCMLARFNNNRTPQACYLCAHLLSYLSGSTHLGLNYLYAEMAGPGYIIQEAYSDADFAGDHRTRRSTAGYLVYVAGGVLSWYSKLMPTLAVSTMESEYMAAFHLGQEVLFLRNFLEEIRLPEAGPTRFCMDAKAALDALANPVFHARTKHIAVKYRWLQATLMQCDPAAIDPVHVISEAQRADPLTKVVLVRIW
ncbi:unnamed protein product, partial [Ectocarpus fasciculatus]